MHAHCLGFEAATYHARLYQQLATIRMLLTQVPCLYAMAESLWLHACTIVCAHACIVHMHAQVYSISACKYIKQQNQSCFKSSDSAVNSTFSKQESQVKRKQPECAVNCCMRLLIYEDMNLHLHKHSSHGDTYLKEREERRETNRAVQPLVDSQFHMKI